MESVQAVSAMLHWKIPGDVEKLLASSLHPSANIIVHGGMMLSRHRGINGRDPA